MAIDFDWVRRELPELADLTDAEITELHAFEKKVVITWLRGLGEEGDRILAERAAAAQGIEKKAA